MDNEIEFDTQEGPKVVQVAAYIRVSTNEQTKKQGPEVQLGSIRKYLDSMSNDDIIYELQDKNIYNETEDFKGVKGDSPIEKRPRMSKMFQDIKEHLVIYDKPPFERLIVWKIDRAARKTLLLYQIVEELQKYDIHFVSVTEHFDISTPFGKAILGILGAFAELERTQISQRTGHSRAISRKKGKVVHEAFGYKKDKFAYLEIYAPEAEIVRRIYQDFVVRNLSIRAIRDGLEADRIPIPRIATANKSTNNQEEINLAKSKVSDVYRWRDGTVRSILQNELYIGKIYYNKSKTTRNYKTGKDEVIHIPKHERLTADSVAPRILEDSIFYAAQERFGEKVGTAKGRNDMYLLQGLIKCGCCAYKRDKKMLNWRNKPGKGKGRRIYLCAGKDTSKFRPHERCSSLPLDGEELEKLVVYHVTRLLDADTYIKYLYENKSDFGVYTKQIKLERDKVKNRIEKLKESKKRLNTLYKNQDIDDSEFRTESDKIVSELEKEGKSLVTMNQSLDSSTNIEAYALGLEEFQKNIKANIARNASTNLHLKTLLNILVKEIIVETRPVNEYDVLPGIKVGDGVDRQMPYKINIVLRLPQEFMSYKLE